MLTKIINFVIAVMLLSVLFLAVDDSTRVWHGKEEVNTISIEEIAGPESGGIFSDYIFSFELLSLLLLVALIGALYIAKKEA